MDVTEERLITEAELMALGSDARVEVINGELVEMTPVGGLHHLIGMNIIRKLDPFVLEKQLGYVFFDGLIYLLHKKGKGLKGALVPDVSYISKSSLIPDWNMQQPYPGAPTLAIEIMSPGDDVTTVLTKVRLYLKAGTEQVWVVYPVQQEIHQYKASTPDTVRVYQGDDVLDVESLFPDLKLVTRDLFIVPDLGSAATR